MRLRLVKEPFDHPDYLYELKHDGFRAVVYIEHGECKLVSRNMKLLRFDSLRESHAKLPVQNAIIDGEIACMDSKGVSRFNELLNRKAEPILYAFDLLWLDGDDLRGFPLISRKAGLHKVIQLSDCARLLYAQHVEGCGKRFFKEICAQDLEGIVAKRRLGIYKDDGNSWLKIKNRAYSQSEGRQELLGRTK
jgi:bifunctional non-homologous end joining protein LigD